MLSPSAWTPPERAWLRAHRDSKTLHADLDSF